MRILVDGYNLALPQGTGVATYGRTLIAAAHALGHDVGVLYGVPRPSRSTNLLNEIAIADPAEMVPIRRSKWTRWIEPLYTARTGIGSISAVEIALTGQVIGSPSRQVEANRAWAANDVYRRAIGLFRKTGVGSRVNVPGVQLAHWTYPLPLEAKGAANVYTLHDLVPLRLPYATADEKRVYLKLCKRIAARADHIVTVSEASRRDIVDLLGVPESRVTNTYQSVDIPESVKAVTEDTLSRYVEGLFGVGLRGYFLFFGAIEPKKNVMRLLEAYLRSGVRTPLVIVGAPGWGGESDTNMLKQLRALDSDGRLIWWDYLPRDMLAMVIAGAKATLFPSLYEGFGLPVAESMAMGTPVLTSDGSSLAEISGDAALLVDPYSVAAITRGIQALDADPDLCADMAARGKVQSARFSPEAYQGGLAKLYEQFA